MRQRRIANPLVDLSLFRIRVFSASLTGMVVTTFVMFGTFFFVSQYFQLVLGPGSAAGRRSGACPGSPR